MSRKSNLGQASAIACTLSLLLSSAAWAAAVIHVNVPVVHPKVPVVIVKPNGQSSGAGAGKVRFNDLHGIAHKAFGEGGGTQGGSPDGAPTESITFVYGQLGTKYTSQKTTAGTSKGYSGSYTPPTGGTGTGSTLRCKHC